MCLTGYSENKGGHMLGVVFGGGCGKLGIVVR